MGRANWEESVAGRTAGLAIEADGMLNSLGDGHAGSGVCGAGSMAGGELVGEGTWMRFAQQAGAVCRPRKVLPAPALAERDLAHRVSLSHTKSPAASSPRRSEPIQPSPCPQRPMAKYTRRHTAMYVLPTPCDCHEARPLTMLPRSPSTSAMSTATMSCAVAQTTGSMLPTSSR